MQQGGSAETQVPVEANTPAKPEYTLIRMNTTYCSLLEKFKCLSYGCWLCSPVSLPVYFSVLLSSVVAQKAIKDKPVDHTAAPGDALPHYHQQAISTLF